MASMWKILAVFLQLALLHLPVQASSCPKPMPGVRKMILGVDVTTLDLLGRGSNDGFRNPVIDLTCTSKGKWTDSKGNTYDMPDQIWHVTSQPWGYIQSTVTLYIDNSHVKEHLGVLTGGDLALKFLFSQSAFYKEVQEALANSTLFVVQVSSIDSANTIRFRFVSSDQTLENTAPKQRDDTSGANEETTLNQQDDSFSIGMDQAALRELEKIRGDFITDPSGYNNFIQHFGTHYFSLGNFGGLLTAVYKVERCYYYQFGEKDVKANVEAGFRGLISVYGGAVAGSTSISESFKEHTTSHFYYFGGDTNLLSSNGFKDWQPTVEAKPWLFSGTLKPISDLIQDKVKRAGMEEAVRQYVMRRYLEELETYLNTKNNQMPRSAQIAFQNRLTAMKHSFILDEVSVQAVGEDIEKERFPSFTSFLSNTELCIKWHPGTDGVSCARDRVCANVNKMTSTYFGNTDDRGDGCLVQWGILNNAPELPTWFREVKLCVRWKVTGHANQCGLGKDGNVCANLNSFTEEYVDITDDRDGGCTLSWKLSLPDSAPIWMHKVELCLSWYPEGDASQCTSSNSGSRTKCSKANEWSDYYTDETISGAGRCSMQWGLKLPPEKETWTCHSFLDSGDPSCPWPIIGGVVGGIVFIALIIIICVLIHRRPRTRIMAMVYE